MNRSNRSVRFTFTFALAAAAFSLALLALPAFAAPEKPQVRRGHGATSSAYSWETGYAGVTSAFEYGLTDRLAVRGVWDEGRYNDPGWPSAQSHQWTLTAKYGLNPNLALEAFAARGWDDLSEGNLYGFGLFTGEQFGRLYASLRAQAISYPYSGTHRWYDQLTAAGTYQVARNLNLTGSLTATLDVGTAWSSSYGVEYQATPQLALQLNRFTGSDTTQLGAEYLF